MDSKKIIRFILPLFWMGLIYYASSQQKVAVTGSFWFSFVIFKSLHLIEYGILFLLWSHALKDIENGNLIAAVVTIIYGASDELHQTFVPTRTGTVRDVFIDGLGVIIAWQIILPKVEKIMERR